MTASFYRPAIVLGLLSAIGPFAIDMYLPALPEIGRDLGSSTSVTQLSLLAFFISFALAQLVYGPLSDMWGRKVPLYIGITLFAFASIGCALAPDIESLIAFRFLQGIGGAAGMVIPRAVVRDMHTGVQAARLMSLLMLVFSISPILAPLTGSAVIEFYGWRGVFWAVMSAAFIGLLLLSTQLEETRPVELRRESSIGAALSAYGLLLRDKNFLTLTFIGGLGIASFMIFLANSPFVLIEHYGLTPTLYSLAFSVNAVSFFAVSQATGYLVGRFGLPRVVRVAVGGYVTAMLALLALFVIGIDSIWALAVLMFIAFGFLGLVLPSTGVLAMEEQGEIAGSASALMGTLQMVIASVVMGIVGAFADGTAMPMVVGFAGCALAELAITLVTLRAGSSQPSPVAAPAE